MKTESKVSGERLTLGKSKKRNQEDHIARYEFAKKYVKSKRVLDIACGTGYGTLMLGEAGANEVVGVDVDEEAVQYAGDNFKKENVRFLCSNANKIQLPDNYFDVIVTLETIEHLDETDRRGYLNELKRVLKDDGVVILSTPNKLITSPWSEKPLNPYHVLEYYRDTLEMELSAYGLNVVAWNGQRFVRKLFTKRIVYLAVRIIEKILRKSFGIYDIADSPEVRPVVGNLEPRYFILLIKKNNVQETV